MKRKHILSFWALLLAFGAAFGQNVGINTSGSPADNSAMLDISASDKGLLIPRVNLTGTGSPGPISAPEVSLLVYNTATTGDVTPGYYYWNGGSWTRLVNGTGNLTADNGLTKTGDNLRLGGNLTEATTIGKNGNNLTISGAGTTTISGGAFDVSGGVISLNNSSNNAVNIGTGTTTSPVTIGGTGTQTISVGNGAANKTVNLGSNNGASTTNINAGTGGVNISTLTSGGNSYVKANSSGRISPQTGVPVTDLTGTVSSANLPGAFSGFANPTNTIGLTATNGTATTAMRSDATPALSQAIVPIWTGQHIFSSAYPQVTLQRAGGHAILDLKTTDNTNFEQGIRFFRNGIQQAEIYTINGDQKLRFYVNAADRMVIDNAGDVGIGVGDPQYKLDVNGKLLTRNGGVSNSVIGTQLLFGYNGGDDYMHGIKTRHHSGQASTNAIDFYVWSYGVDATKGEPTKRVMTIDGAGTNGAVQIYGLAGTGNRPVYADANGTLSAMPSVLAHVDRSQKNYSNANVGWIVVTTTSGSLAVTAGDIITVTLTAKFAFTGGSGGDDVIFGVTMIGACGTIYNDDYYFYQDYDNNRDEYLPIVGQYVFTAPCTGNVQFRLEMDHNSSGDDAAKIGDIVIVARRN